MNIPISIQMHTLREEAKKDMLGTLEKVAEIGYKGVEFVNFESLNASKMKEVLNRLGLKPTGSHIFWKDFEANFDECIEYNLEIGNKYIICKLYGMKTMQDFIEAAKLYNTIGEKCRDKGIQLCYHNHSFEFDKYNGKFGLDILLEESEKELLHFELDTYWIRYAGFDPVDWIKKYSGRCPLIHLKDMKSIKSKEEMLQTEVGNGVMNISSIVSCARETGVKWQIVELGKLEMPPFESIKVSYDNLLEIFKNKKEGEDDD